jgi:GNAT superfamily N-acetyltransferase
MRIRRLDAVDDATIQSLSELLVAVVAGGASVSFMHPLAPERARAFWRGVAEGVAAGDRALLVAEDGGAVVGTVQLLWKLPENQPHRAEVAKLMVDPRARKQGVGAALMNAVEAEARAHEKTLLVLDTETGGPAERLYERLGWQLCGRIPDYALRPHGGFASTTVFYKSVSSA